MADNTRWAAQINADIAAAGVVDIHGDCDMLKLSHVSRLGLLRRHSITAEKTLVALGDFMVDSQPRRGEPRLWLHKVPGASTLHQVISIDLSESPVVAELRPDGASASCCRPPSRESRSQPSGTADHAKSAQDVR